MENIDNENPCRGGDCGWGYWDESLNCGGSGVGCAEAYFLECEESDFHDANLVKATRAIKAILAMIPNDINGRNLSLLQTKLGVVLAWTEHTETYQGGGITRDSDDADVINALNIKMPSAY
jgi:hypothetical protein